MGLGNASGFKGERRGLVGDGRAAGEMGTGIPGQAGGGLHMEALCGGKRWHRVVQRSRAHAHRVLECLRAKARGELRGKRGGGDGLAARWVARGSQTVVRLLSSLWCLLQLGTRPGACTLKWNMQQGAWLVQAGNRVSGGQTGAQAARGGAPHERGPGVQNLVEWHGFKL